MKFYQILFTFFISSILLISACDDNSTGVEETESDVEVQEVQDLNADRDNEQYTFFNLRNGQEVQHSDSASTNWDIAFHGTSVIFNSGVSGPGDGGVLDLDVAFNQVEIAPLPHQMDIAQTPTRNWPFLQAVETDGTLIPDREIRRMLFYR